MAEAHEAGRAGGGATWPAVLGSRGRGFAGPAKEKGGANRAGLLARERGLRVGPVNWLLGCLG